MTKKYLRFRSPDTIVFYLLTPLTILVTLPSLIAALRDSRHKYWIYAVNIGSVVFIGTGSASDLAYLVVIAWLGSGVASFLAPRFSTPQVRVPKAQNAPRPQVEKPSKNFSESLSELEPQAAPEQPKVSESQTSTQPQETEAAAKPQASAKKEQKPKPQTPPKESKTTKGFWHYMFIGRPKVARIEGRIESNRVVASQIASEHAALKSKLASLPQVFEDKTEERVFAIAGCDLIEARKGARVTERESSSSGRGYAGVRVGPVYLGGSGGSTGYSQTISYPAPDILQKIDSGSLIISTRKLSFAGSLFTKSTDFAKIVDYTTEGRSLLIAPSTGSKVWICQFPSVSDQWLTSIVLEVAGQSATRKLLNDGLYSDVMNLKQALQSAINYKNAEIEFAVSELDEETKLLVEEHKAFEAQYPRIVKPIEV